MTGAEMIELLIFTQLQYPFILIHKERKEKKKLFLFTLQMYVHTFIDIDAFVLPLFIGKFTPNFVDVLYAH